MIPGECVGTDGYTCKGDSTAHGDIKLKLQVCRSAAGWYLGYSCPKCGPVSRETGYFADEAEAEAALKNPGPHLRKPGFDPAVLGMQASDDLDKLLELD